MLERHWISRRATPSSNGIGVYLNVKNLSDAPWRIYEGTRNRVIQQEYYDFTYEAGMKFKF